VHLDIRKGGEDVAAIRERLVERGATVLHEGRQGPHTWVTMADPEGNEFCI
jgi:predicted enzyme related to lactoylglutathione lyase